MSRLSSGCRCRCSALLLLVIALGLIAGLIAGPVKAREAFLVTYGPGQEVWELFGHNAIWIRDSTRELDHTFSFGYFELDRPGFHRDFARGIMPYYGSASRVEMEFEFYRSRGRSIRVQQLDLDDDQIIRLYNRMYGAIFPQPQYYDYHYYRANCSTWLRDLLDEVTGGALRQALAEQPAARNFRDHTRAMTAHRYWLHTGIMTLLGPSVDRPITVWEELFLPRRLAEALTEVTVAGQPLVLADEMQRASELDNQRGQPESTAGRSALLGLASLALVLLPMVLGRPRLARLIRLSGTVAVGLAGFVIVLMWLGSGHDSTWRNVMALVLNPLWLLMPILAPGRLRRALWWLLATVLFLGSAYLALPWGQFRADQLLWFVPLVSALLLGWWPDRWASKSR